MGINLKIGVLLAVFCFALGAEAKTRVLLVSDIDDTIKVSHILNWGGKLTRAANVSTPFRGMAELYRLIKQQDLLSTQIVYLSNAPERIAGMPLMDISHRSFLSLNNFPFGEMELRENLQDKQHKIRTLRRLMGELKPEVVILFGDNGEKDPEVYNQFYKEYSKETKIFSFIHQLYSSKSALYLPDFVLEKGSVIYPEQIGYVTPIEVSYVLKSSGLISESSYRSLLRNILPSILRESWINWDGLAAVTFPFYKKCPDFQWRWDRAIELSALKRKVMTTCQ